MPITWFRFYHEALDDPKVQKLDPADFKVWVNLLCLTCRNDGKLPPVADIAFALRMDLNACKTVLERLSNAPPDAPHDAPLIDRLSGGHNGMHYAMHGWDKRQYKSDSSTERVKRFRNVAETVNETPPEQIQIQSRTEQKIDKENTIRRSQARGSRLPADWQPAEHLDRGEELEKFRDYWIAQPGQKGVKLDWDATWRNWIRNARPAHARADGLFSAKERDLRSIPDKLLSNDEYWKKRKQLAQG